MDSPDLFTAVLQGTVDRVLLACPTHAHIAGFVLAVRVWDAWPGRRRRAVHRLTLCWPNPAPADRARLVRVASRLTAYAAPSRDATRTRVWVVTTGVFFEVSPGATVAPSPTADDTAEKATVHHE